MTRWKPEGTIFCKNSKHGAFIPESIDEDGECPICRGEKIRRLQEKSKQRLYCGDCDKLQNYRYYERPKEFDKED